MSFNIYIFSANKRTEWDSKISLDLPRRDIILRYDKCFYRVVELNNLSRGSS